MNPRANKIIDFLSKHGENSSKQIHLKAAPDISYATLKRILNKLLSENLVSSNGQGKSTKYGISPLYQLIKPIEIETYFKQEIDEREITKDFNFSILTKVLANFNVFTNTEIAVLNQLQKQFEKNISQLNASEFRAEFERLAIDLSWKSSQIEGNTYSLLETERLLNEKVTASGKTKEEAIMLLNHKEALDFIFEHPDYLFPLSVSKIEDIHSILIKNLAIDRNIRKRRVGISGTNYRPLDNIYQINEALECTFDLIFHKENTFEKALLALVLLSYIQPFLDGNKRTARIVSNALLIHEKYCPLSFRTVDSIEYKKAMLLFYEQNNITAIKEIFIQQYEFSVNTYF